MPRPEGEFVTKALGLGRLSKSISRGRNWISAIKSRFVGNEAWDRMSGEMDGVGQDLQTKVQDQIDQQASLSAKVWCGPKYDGF